MNVYDWDDTIYRGDSTLGFVLYLYAHRPLTLLSIPRTACCGLLYGLRIMPKLAFKQNLYHMFVFVKDMDRVCDEYVASHMDHVKEFYLQQQKEDDVVISASPLFLISRFCKAVGISYCDASHVDMRTGKYNGINCHGEEKVKRFREMFPAGQIDGFYSDSYSDTPLALLAKEAYIVKGEQCTPWGNGKSKSSI